MKLNHLMKFFQLMLVFILAVGLSGCSTTVESRRTYNSSTDFSGLQSYAWSHNEDGIFPVPESTEHFQRAVDKLLTANGFKLNPEAPDFLIVTHYIPTYVEKYQMIDGELDYPQSMVRINLVIPSSNKVIYESAVNAYPDDYPTQESRNAKVDEAVEALLGAFPPGR
jgi:Domain of unknown function (DUF4136)